MVQAPGHRFTDHPLGHVSIVNLASVRALERRVGRPVDPLRFRANLYAEGWPAWAENAAVGGAVRLGAVRGKVFKPIVRCAATEVDPATGVRDIEVVRALHDHFGHLFCGIYIEVTQGGVIAEGDAVELDA